MPFATSNGMFSKGSCWYLFVIPWVSVMLSGLVGAEGVDWSDYFPGDPLARPEGRVSNPGGGARTQTTQRVGGGDTGTDSGGPQANGGAGGEARPKTARFAVERGDVSNRSKQAGKRKTGENRGRGESVRPGRSNR